jgi:hypothetical protein
MPPLAELQRTFAAAVLDGDAPAGLFAGRVTPREALAIHRGTIIGALTNALRLSHPTVEALVGPKFFDQAAGNFVEQNLPKAASLNAYGAGFADFLADFEPAATLPYLPDVARLDRAIEVALHTPAQPRRFALDAAAAIDLPQSLAVLALHYPADEIRAALGDDAALAAIALEPGERFVLVWRKGDEAVVQRIDPAAGRFLQALLAGEGAEAAFQAAAARSSQADALHAIQAGIFAAPFCTIISTTKDSSP